MFSCKEPPNDHWNGRLFISVAQIGSNSVNLLAETEEWETLTWRFLAYVPATGEWSELQGPAGPYFWVSRDAKRIIYFLDGALWLRDETFRDRRLMQIPWPNYPLFQGAWSPDGRWFATTYRFPGSLKANDNFESLLLEVDRGVKTRLPLEQTEGVRDWSPDGEFLLVLSETAHAKKRQINLVRPDGSDRQLIATDGVCTQACFSSDGRQIASTRGPRLGPTGQPNLKERGAVWVRDLQSGEDRMLTNHIEISCQDVRWASDDSKLVFKGFERHPG